MRSADCHEPGGGRADVGIGPYEKTGSGSVGADFISARAHQCIGCTIAERCPPQRLRGQAPLCKGSCHAQRD